MMTDDQQANQDKLRALMVEVREICVRADIGAAVLLYDKHQSEQLMHVGASWSCMTYDPVSGVVRVKSKLEEYGGDIEKQREEQNRTVGMLTHFFAYAERLLANIAGLLQVIEDAGLKIETTEGKFTPHGPDKKPTKH